MYGYLGFSGTAVNDANCASRERLERQQPPRVHVGVRRDPLRDLQPLLHAELEELRLHQQRPGGGIHGVGLRGARSRHAGGVNLLLGRRRVRFVRDSVALPVWRAVGTRAGGEPGPEL